jgi:quercetin dioxygenase-like cupin family protein
MLKTRIDSGVRDQDLAARPDWEGAELRWLVDSDQAGAELGALGLITVQPGAEYAAHRYGEVDRTLYLLDGSGEHRAGDEHVALVQDDSLYVGRGRWHGFRNRGQEPARVLAVYSPRPGVLDYELLDDGVEVLDQGLPSIPLESVPDDPNLADDQGWYGLSVKWLVTDESAGAGSALLGASRFEPGGSHVLHRHPIAEEILFVREGGGWHLHPDGREEAIEPGTVTFAGRGEWHGFKARGDVETSCLFVYMGAAALDGAGYELMEEIPA